MKNNNRYYRHKVNLLPYQVIVSASSGDVEAMRKVLNHYDGYITKLSTRVMYDEFGQAHYYVDEELKRRLVTKLITKTLNFKITKI